MSFEFKKLLTRLNLFGQVTTKSITYCMKGVYF